MKRPRAGEKTLKRQQVDTRTIPVITTDPLLLRVATILDQARGNVVRAVNSNMVIAYWLIGREIVQEIQRGEGRAEYGETVLRKLAAGLTTRYGKGFSNSNLKYIRQFHQVFSDRIPAIGHLASGQFETIGLGAGEIGHKPCGQLAGAVGRSGGKSGSRAILDDLSFAADSSKTLGFSVSLSWSHYRTLLQVENKNERLFYEIEAEKEGWSVPQLERQIHSFLFVRLLKSRNKAEVLKLAQEGQVVSTPVDVIKHPYVLDFLGLPEANRLRESELEAPSSTICNSSCWNWARALPLWPGSTGWPPTRSISMSIWCSITICSSALSLST